MKCPDPHVNACASIKHEIPRLFKIQPKPIMIYSYLLNEEATILYCLFLFGNSQVSTLFLSTFYCLKKALEISHSKSLIAHSLNNL